MTRDSGSERPLSLEKAQALNRYARGEISLADMDAALDASFDERHASHILYIVGSVLAAVLAIVLVPASSRRS